VAEVLSPKLHAYPVTPTLSVDAEPSKKRDWPSSTLRSPPPRGTGASVSRTVTVKVELAALPEKSHTVNVAV